jgi:hypothetical protein
VFPSPAVLGGTNAVLYTAALADDDVIEVFRSVSVRSVTTRGDEETKSFHGAVQLLRAQTGVRLTEAAMQTDSEHSGTVSLFQYAARVDDRARPIRRRLVPDGRKPEHRPRVARA